MQTGRRKREPDVEAGVERGMDTDGEEGREE